MSEGGSQGRGVVGKGRRGLVTSIAEGRTERGGPGTPSDPSCCGGQDQGLSPTIAPCPKVGSTPDPGLCPQRREDGRGNKKFTGLKGLSTTPYSPLSVHPFYFRRKTSPPLSLPSSSVSFPPLTLRGVRTPLTLPSSTSPV